MYELSKMQNIGANIYKYLLIKTIETLVVDGINYPNKGMLKNTYKYLREDLEIARAVCTMFPNEMVYSECARNDIQLALRLINKKKISKSGLDHLCKFDSSVLSNPLVLKDTVLLLEKELIENPMYRFEYVDFDIELLNKGVGRLLDYIFDRCVSDSDLMFMADSYKRDVVRSLINIEPAYAISLPIDCFKKYPSVGPNNNDVAIELINGINNYADRYGISMDVGNEYYGKDILTNPDQNVKRLLKRINNGK